MQLTTAQTTVPLRALSDKKTLPIFIAMIALADVLMFQQAPGLNLFLFSLSLTSAVLMAARKRLGTVKTATCLGVTALAAAPLLEAPSIIGAGFAVAAVISSALACANLLPKKPVDIPLTLLRFIPLVPLRLPSFCRRYLASQSGQTFLGVTQTSLAGWLLPLGLGLVFLLLFTMANPLIALGLHNIDLSFLIDLFDITRIGFWLLAAVGISALLRPRLMRKVRHHTTEPADISRQSARFLDHAALLRCLWVFNLLFAIQTALDVLYLWGGAELPAGMSHAQYAHRGAYPLVATALLAAAFVLVAMRRGGPGDSSRLIRMLVIAWILQNVMLCLSAILRLDLYVQTYSLTGLRMAAGIWMGLVATGLVFILLRIKLRRSNEWLISMNLATLLTVLYLSAFFDFSDFIARFNVEHSAQVSEQDPPIDLAYLHSLGPSAIPAIDTYLAAVPKGEWKHEIAKRVRDRLAASFAMRSSDWRSWNYRDYRIKNYISSTALIGP
ncbi:DUF4173 domain-containing protein [Agrobacterium sp.]|uniref:DUF4153 domain-containing protein n=1 Tax=Agrobacterium sp. TaxID=361 RepID=UPI0028B05FE4|nr:DUF4173 domain-containing protein [Agrobacterium sp.]